MAYESPTHKVFFHARTPLFLFIRRAARRDIAYIEEKGDIRRGGTTQKTMCTVCLPAQVYWRDRNIQRALFYTHIAANVCDETLKAF